MSSKLTIFNQKSVQNKRSLIRNEFKINDTKVSTFDRTRIIPGVIRTHSGIDSYINVRKANCT